MSGVVPPTIDKPKTVIGVGMRELIILGTGLLLGLLIVVSPLGLVLKVALVALVIGLAALLAIGRAPTTGKTFEEHFLDIFRFYGRGRFLQRGTSTEKEIRREVEQPVYRASEIEKVFRKESTRGIVRVKPLPLSWGGLFGVISFAFLLAFLVWMWTGGLEELLIRFGLMM